MIDLYYAPTPNGHKITLFLEEAELDYRIIRVDISKGEQFSPLFLAISPNNKIPAIIDNQPADGGRPLSLFESGEILLYLAEKTGKLLSGAPLKEAHRAAVNTAAYVCTKEGGWPTYPAEGVPDYLAEAGK